jgi:hypothetical protein
VGAGVGRMSFDYTPSLPSVGAVLYAPTAEIRGHLTSRGDIAGRSDSPRLQTQLRKHAEARQRLEAIAEVASDHPDHLYCSATIYTATDQIESAIGGTPALFLANTYKTMWRRKEDGRDIWHASVSPVVPEPLGRNDVMLEMLRARLEEFVARHATAVWRNDEVGSDHDTV